MFGSVYCLLLSLIFVLLPLNSVLANTCQPPIARQVVDQLMVANIDGANELLDRWKTTGKETDLSYLFYHGMALWTVAEVAEASQKEDAQTAALEHLEALLDSIDKNEVTASSEIEHRLLKGMTQAFAGRTYLQQGAWLNAYRYGRAGRDTLRELIQDHPGVEDAYLILGLYEYYTGTVPTGFKWLAKIIDLDGDEERGVQYLERAAQYSPLAGPEAARMLLNGIPFVPERGCTYLGLAAEMRSYYDTEVFYSFDLQKRYLACGKPDKAIEENRRISQGDKELSQEEIQNNRYLALYAARDLGDISIIEALKTELMMDLPFWMLMKAEALDVNGQRDQAIALYGEVEALESAKWIKEQSKIYKKNRYTRSEKTYSESNVLLNVPCKGDES